MAEVKEASGGAHRAESGGGDDVHLFCRRGEALLINVVDDLVRGEHNGFARLDTIIDLLVCLHCSFHCGKHTYLLKLTDSQFENAKIKVKNAKLWNPDSVGMTILIMVLCFITVYHATVYVGSLQ
jgi:hypothetical protein